MSRNVEKTEKFNEKQILKKHVYSTQEQLNGSSIVIKFDVVRDTYVELKNEVYLTLDEAKNRAKELNKDVDAIKIQ